MGAPVVPWTAVEDDASKALWWRSGFFRRASAIDTMVGLRIVVVVAPLVDRSKLALRFSVSGRSKLALCFSVSGIDSFFPRALKQPIEGTRVGRTGASTLKHRTEGTRVGRIGAILMGAEEEEDDDEGVVSRRFVMQVFLVFFFFFVLSLVWSSPERNRVSLALHAPLAATTVSLPTLWPLCSEM